MLRVDAITWLDGNNAALKMTVTKASELPNLGDKIGQAVISATSTALIWQFGTTATLTAEGAWTVNGDALTVEHGLPADIIIQEGVSVYQGTGYARYENTVEVEWQDGYFVNTSGEIKRDNNYSVSSPIALKKGQRIVFSATASSSCSILTKYVGGKATRIIDGSATPPLRYLVPLKFWVADEDCTVRICHDIRANSTNRIIPNDQVKPTIFNDVEFLANEPLFGKKMVVIGDSLTSGSRIGEYPTWVNWLAGKYRMTVVNASIGGSSIAQIPEGADGSDLHDPIVDRYNPVLQANKDADIIVYQGGANDRTWAVPLGLVTSNSKSELSGAMNRIINGSRIICPKAKIFFIALPWRWASANSISLTEADYAGAMRAVCQAKSIPCRCACLDGDVDFRDTSVAAWADEGIWLGEEANRHYSPDGYQFILPMVEKFLNQ